MDNLFFYPVINKQIIDAAGCYCLDYKFGYYNEEVYIPLQVKGRKVKHLEDETETWKVENDGFRLERQVIVEYSDAFKGGKGVMCKGAEMGLCIIWNNPRLKQMGYINPVKTVTQGTRLIYDFDYQFEKGCLKGNLILDTVIYIKKASEIILRDEMNLINEAGVSLGTIDTVSIAFDTLNMDFPVVDVNDPSQPLWWLEFKDWEDPRKDQFDEDHLCLYLNSYYESCPKIGEKIKNIEMLIEIITTTYLMIIRKIDEMNYLNDTLNGIDLEPGSISAVINYFYTSHVAAFKYDSIDALHKSIHQNIELMLRSDDNNESV